MGIAKNIEGYGIYADYCSDVELFIKDLSDKLNSDFILNSFDSNFDPLHIENKETNYNKLNKYKLNVMYQKYKNGCSISELPTYELTLPINYINENSIELIFYPNNVLQIIFLTFELLWSSFIEVLKFQSVYECREKAIDQYQTLRTEYINILRKLNIEKIIILTDAYYNTESIIDYGTYNTLIFDDIIKIAIEEDNLNIFDFEQILNIRSAQFLKKDFIQTPDLRIMLIDNLTIN